MLPFFFQSVEDEPQFNQQEFENYSKSHVNEFLYYFFYFSLYKILILKFELYMQGIQNTHTEPTPADGHHPQQQQHQQQQHQQPIHHQ
jgi:hypothetical protein